MIYLPANYKPYKTNSLVWDGKNLVSISHLQKIIKPVKQKLKESGKRKTGSSMTDYSLKAGRSRNYFKTLKEKSPDTFEFIEKHGQGDLAKGYFILKNHLKQKEIELKQAYNYLLSLEKAKHLSLELYGNETQLPRMMANIYYRGGIKTLLGIKKANKVIDFAKQQGWKNETKK